MDVLVIPHVPRTISGVPGRFDFFIENLKLRNHVHVLSWNMPYPLRNIKDLKRIRERFTKKIERNVTLHHVARPLVFPPFNKDAVTSQISDIIMEYGIDVIFSESFIWDVVPPFDYVPVIYDLVDDHVASFKNVPLSKRFMSKFLRIERAIIHQIENSDHTFFVSSVLRDKYWEMSRSSSVLPNGVDVDRFKNANPDEYIEKLHLDNYDCILGYVGYFGEWSNLYKTVINLYEFLEKNNGVIIIAGSGPEIKYCKKRLGNTKRLIFMGMVEYQKIPSLMKTFDIGLLPFKKYPFTDAASPIKYFEYSAAGLKIVSSPLEELKRINFNNTIFFEDITSIGSAVEKAMNMDFDKSKLTKSIKEYDWSMLSRKIENVFKVKIKEDL
ncbi:MAG TPA: glycosyltransferase [Methanothermobacter sp.]|nr:predicted glycosyltransferase [Methanothermobacter sp. MT-2]HHW05630.1 glycosyltransferase family 4 protein [Methanothermobacter sp.]HOK72730.1 glycosyltransferase [Methanothermobacter sp.]HOL68550.1 glycosyltransferase [Methanothermobacter sp.]HPQ04309.1 glycosyltransferase [Methanothermobacter sp.]